MNRENGPAAGNCDVRTDPPQHFALDADIRRLLGYIARDKEQQRFDFAADLGVQLPGELCLLQECCRVLSAAIDRSLPASHLATRPPRSALDAPLPSPATLDEIHARLVAIEQSLSCLDRALEENQKLRQRDFTLGFLTTVVRLISSAIDGLEDDATLFKHSLKDVKSPRESKFCTEAARMALLRRDGLLEALNTLSVEPFRSERGQILDPRRARVLEGVPAPRPALAGKVSKSVRAGYWRPSDGHVFRLERVNVFAVPVVQ